MSARSGSSSSRSTTPKSVTCVYQSSFCRGPSARCAGRAEMCSRRLRVTSMFRRTSPSSQSYQVATDGASRRPGSSPRRRGLARGGTPRSRAGRVAGRHRVELTLRRTRVPVALQARVRLPERHRAVVFVGLLRRQVGLGGGDELLLGGSLLDPAATTCRAARAARRGAGRRRRRAPKWISASRSGARRSISLERAVPSLDVDVRRRCRRQHWSGSAGSGRPRRRPRRASCRRSSRRGARRGPARGRPRGPQRGRSRSGRSPRARAPARPRARRTCRRRAVARCARAGTGRRGAARRSPRPRPGAPGCSRTSKPAAPAWSRWMCESSSCFDVAELVPALREPRLQRRKARRRPAIEQGQSLGRVQEVRPDRSGRARVEQVDRFSAAAK